MHERAETWNEANPDGRWRCFDYDELHTRELSLELFWIKETMVLPIPTLYPHPMPRRV
jgi:type I restriction enzyme M protein